MRIPREEHLDAEGGLEFARFARQFDHELPVLLSSAERANADKAADLGAIFVDKNSERALALIRGFFRSSLGFGDFIFRNLFAE